MNAEIKLFIEKNIKLIEENMFDQFFDRAEVNFTTPTLNKLSNILQTAKIDVINHMTFIPEGFYRLSDLEIYKTPSNIVKIHANAFDFSDLVKLHVTSNVYKICFNAFASTELTEVIMDEGVTRLQDSVFSNCRNLSYVNFPKSIQYMGNYVFDSCPKLLTIYFNGNKTDLDNSPLREHLSYYKNNVSQIICFDGTVEL